MSPDGPGKVKCYEMVHTSEIYNNNGLLNFMFFAFAEYQNSVAGVMCMTSSCTTNLCPGDDIIFTCKTSSTLTFTWLVIDGDGARTTCTAFTDGIITDPTCGPMNVFSLSVSGDGSTSTLSAQSVDDTLNGISVLCGDEDVDETICVVGICMQECFVSSVSQHLGLYNIPMKGHLDMHILS